MANLPSSFIITLDGTPITKVTEPDEELVQAEVNHSNPAVFTLKDGLLESDGLYLGRSWREDRSLLPKRVFWHKKGENYEMIQKTTIDDEDGKLVIKNGGAVLALIDGKVFGELLQRQPAAVGIHPA